jgi:hypothetical protein
MGITDPVLREKMARDVERAHMAGMRVDQLKRERLAREAAAKAGEVA